MTKTYADKLAAAFEEHRRLHHRLFEIEKALARPVEIERRRELTSEARAIVQQFREGV